MLPILTILRSYPDYDSFPDETCYTRIEPVRNRKSGLMSISEFEHCGPARSTEQEDYSGSDHRGVSIFIGTRILLSTGLSG